MDMVPTNFTSTISVNSDDPYTSTFIRLPHLYQEFCVHCIFIRNGRGMG